MQKEALVKGLLNHVPKQDNHEAVKNSVDAILTFMDQREFYSKKTFQQSFELRTLFQEALWEKIELDRKEIRIRIRDGEEQDVVMAEYLSNAHFEEWYDILLKEMSEKLHG